MDCVLFAQFSFEFRKGTPQWTGTKKKIISKQHNYMPFQYYRMAIAHPSIPPSVILTEVPVYLH